MGHALNRYINTIPKVYKPETNLVIHALLLALANNDDNIESAIALGKDQLFVRTEGVVGVLMDVDYWFHIPGVRRISRHTCRQKQQSRRTQEVPTRKMAIVCFHLHTCRSRCRHRSAMS